MIDTTLRDLGVLVRAGREDRKISQEDLAKAVVPPTNRTAVALLEQGRRLPPEDALRSICSFLSIPTAVWLPLLDPGVLRRLDFEEVLGELVGRTVTLRHHDGHASSVAQDAIDGLFGTQHTRVQLYDAFCAALVYYGIDRPRPEFFEHYFKPSSFNTLDAFRGAVNVYQKDAIRLFPSFAEGYDFLSHTTDLNAALEPLAPRSDDRYRNRADWNVIEDIPDALLPDLGYISAARVKKEQEERTAVAEFLETLAAKVAVEGRSALLAYSEKKRRKIGSLLRKFESVLQHDLLSPLFGADPDELLRESRRLAPKEAADLQRMEQTQQIGQRNLARYLASDHLDVYVATSMRTDADFVSVNAFVRSLFSTTAVKSLKLRYFNPTQSWIEDRIAKGLVEALMLMRADFTLYMAQKTDTFGKDSEASVALGQGKPVIVFVPKLLVPAANVDSEILGLSTRAELQSIIESEATGDDADVDETTDHQALLSQVLTLRLSSQPTPVLVEAARKHWADFDLYGEAARIDDAQRRAAYRSWLDSVVARENPAELTPELKLQIIGILVATATNAERRALTFRQVHPLAVQVIRRTGVLNGILVARSVETCATLLEQLVRNELSLDLRVETENYQLIEKSTQSPVRVISRHQLITNAFSAFYVRS